MSVGSIANKVISVGKDVAYGMRGDYAGFTKEFGKKVLKSNMTEAQIKKITKKNFETINFPKMWKMMETYSWSPNKKDE